MGNPWDKKSQFNDDANRAVEGGGQPAPSYYRKCEHRGDALDGVPRLYASSYRGGLMAENAQTITVILTPEALPMAIRPGFSTIALAPFYAAHGQVVYWPWRDMSIPKDQDVLERVEALLAAYRAGWAIEVACYGGHGRTGTLLAILAGAVMNWEPQEAVRKVRHAYCDKAVETRGQEHFVVHVLTALRSGATVLPQEVADLDPTPAYEGSEAAGTGSSTDAELLSELEKSLEPQGTEQLEDWMQRRNVRIRDLRREGYTLREIGEMVGLSFQQVSKILLSGK